MEHSSKKEIGKTILVVAAHPDDEVLGCGGSIAKWTALGHIVHVLIMAEGATSRSSIRDRKVKREELSLLEKSANSAGKILEYKINLNIQVIVRNFLTGGEILSEIFDSSSSYKVQDQYFETTQFENRSVENLINNAYEELLIKLSENMLTK